MCVQRRLYTVWTLSRSDKGFHSPLSSVGLVAVALCEQRMLICVFNGQTGLENGSEYEQEIPQSHTTDQPAA